MKALSIALDWTPNTNHSGFFVAQQQGFYAEVGLQVDIVSPQMDNYSTTPAKKLELGQVDFALCPFESVLSYRVKEAPFDAVAIATLFQEDLSAIVTLSESGLERPKDLDGRSYASYKARYEDAIVAAMVKNDGGKGELKLEYRDKLGIWETLLTKKADATWVFMNWEGIQAQNRGIALNAFLLSDFGIPYGYSPIIMAGKSAAAASTKEYRLFLEATRRGYLYAAEHPKETVALLAPLCSEQDGDIDLMQSQRYTAPFYGTSETWGLMEKERVLLFLNWLAENGLEKHRFSFEEIVWDLLRDPTK
ncbi:ABC transporter substrate-binding protein [Maribacter sp. 2-571]|uniref:ABC transporter substrate-binding protein n=1 Tax=Maribacter sp. 2-571 TaxID=3417569 RepID=UPI003D32AA02